MAAAVGCSRLGFRLTGSAPRRYGYRRGYSRRRRERSVPIATPLSREPEPGRQAPGAEEPERLASARQPCGAFNEARQGQDAEAARGSRPAGLREPGRLAPGRGSSALGQVRRATPSLAFQSRASAVMAPLTRKSQGKLGRCSECGVEVYEVKARLLPKRSGLHLREGSWFGVRIQGHVKLHRNRI